MSLRSPYDRQILRFAIPALGALAAEPLYVLVDTAIVGHLGRSQLAALGVAATVLSVLAMFNFLQYGTTAQVARATGAGEDLTAARLGAQALWLSLGFGTGLAVAVALFAVPVVELIGAEGASADYAVTYLRIASLGIPSAFIAIGGQGFLRGVSDLRTPLVIVIAANLVNVVLELLFVYGLGLGIEGSAWGTVIAQTAMGVAMAGAILRRVGRANAGFDAGLARRLLSLGKFIFIRTVALIASFVLAGAVVARLGEAPLAAYQIAFQLWIFLALVLDSIAIAGQIIVGRELGAARPAEAFAASVRMIWLSVVTGAVFALVLLAFGTVIPRAFTSDAEVLAQCALLWPIFALMQPFNGIVFALDGILIGASDGRYLALAMAAAFLACVGALAVSSRLDAGVRGAWLALALLISTRLVLMGARFLRRRWLVTGLRVTRRCATRRHGSGIADATRSGRRVCAMLLERREGATQPIHSACASSARGRGSIGSRGAATLYASTSSGSEARQSARAAATNVSSSMPWATRSPQRCSVPRSPAMWSVTSSNTPKWVNARRAGALSSVSVIVRSQASRSMSGGGVGASTNPAPCDPYAHRVAREERAVFVEERDVVARMAGAREAREPDDVVTDDPGCSPPGRGRARPTACRTRHHRASARSPPDGSARRDAARRPPDTWTRSAGARGRELLRRRRDRSGCGRAADVGCRRARAHALRGPPSARERRSSDRSRRVPVPSSVSTR